MPTFLPPLLVAILLLIFIPIDIRMIAEKGTEIDIEIQPICIVLTKEKSTKKGNRGKKKGNKRDLFDLIRAALPYSRITVSAFDVSLFSDELFPLYKNVAYLGATLYPLLSYLGSLAKKLTVENGALECTPREGIERNASLYLDITFSLRLYSVILVLTKYLILKARRANNAGRNEGAY